MSEVANKDLLDNMSSDVELRALLQEVESAPGKKVSVLDAAQGGVKQRVPAKKAGQQQMPIKPLEQPKLGSTVIDSDTVIVGEVTTHGKITVCGEIRGNVTSESNVSVVGKVTGNVTGGVVQISSEKLDGDVRAKDAVEIGDDATVIGNISGRSVNVRGKVRGNITAEEGLVIGPNAEVMGDLESATINVDSGAVIDGRFAMKGRNSFSSPIFKDGVE